MSGEDFHTTYHYYYHIGFISGIVALFGIVSVLFFVVSLYLRSHHDFFKCRPVRPIEEENEFPIMNSEHERQSVNNGQQPQQDGNYLAAEDDFVGEIIERVELEEQFGFSQLPHAVAESVSDEDEKEKMKAGAVSSYSDDEGYEEKLKNKLDNFGVEYADGDEPDVDKKKKLDEDEDEDDEEETEVVLDPATYFYNNQHVPYPHHSLELPPFPFDPTLQQQQQMQHPHSDLPPHPFPGSFYNMQGSQYSHGNLHYIDPQQYNAAEESAAREERKLQKQKSRLAAKAAERENDSVGSEEIEAYPWDWKRKSNAFILYSLCLITLVFLQFYLVSASVAADGVKQSYERMGELKDRADVLFAYSNQFVSYGVALQNNIQNAEVSCTYHGHQYFTRLEASLASYRVTSLALANSLSPLIANLETVQTYQKYFAQGAPLYILWVLGMVLLFLIVYFSYQESRANLKATVAYGTSILLIFILIGAILLSLTMYFGDLCTDPSYNVVTNIAKSADSYSLAAYYSTCNGEEYTTFIQADGNVLNKNINFMYNRTDFAISNSQVCPDDPNLKEMNTILINANSTMAVYNQVSRCQPIQQIWYELLNEEVCDTLFTGVFYAWGGQLLTSFFLFLLLITASITYEFYPNYDKTPDDSTGDISEFRESTVNDEDANNNQNNNGGDSAVVLGQHDPNEEKQDEPVVNNNSISNDLEGGGNRRQSNHRRSLNSSSHNNNNSSSSNDQNLGSDGFVFHSKSRDDEDDDVPLQDVKRRSFYQKDSFLNV
jgi:hypothetical protein